MAMTSASATVAQSSPEYPVVIRLAEDACNSGDGVISETSPVDVCVVGTRSRGTAQVRGRLTIDFLPSHRHASLRLIFSGTSVSRTVAREGPAVIHATTTSRFTAWTDVRFDEVQGFTAGATRVDVQIVNQQRQIASTAPRLRGRIVRRAARRRIDEQRGCIRQTTIKTTQDRLRQSMARRVAERIAAWNQHWDQLRAALQQQRWYPDMPKPFFATTARELIVVFADDPTIISHAAQNGVEIPSLPTSNQADVVAEIFLKNDWLDDTQYGDLVVAYLQAIPQDLLAAPDEEPPVSVSARHADGWQIFQFVNKSERPQSSP